MPRFPAVALAVLMLSLPLAGCLKGGDDPAPASTDPSQDNRTNDNATLPDGRVFAAVEETNKTEEGVGGVDHKHDYWDGREQVVIFDDEIAPFLAPTFERDDNTKVMIAFINLDKLPEDADLEEEKQREALVYEGTGLVSFAITKGPAWASEFALTFRTAAQDWTAPTPISVGDTFEYTPTKLDTDMPHSFRSLWNWKLQATGPVPATGELGLTSGSPVDNTIHVTITVTKSNAVDDWPGHPAFYDGVDERVVVDDAPGQTNVQQAADVLIYGVEPDQVVPEKLISMGTRYLDVYVNITSLTLPPGVQSDGFTLFWRTAATPPDALGYNPGNNDTDGTTWAYWHLEVSDDELDSPYQPTSRFSFKVLANPANDDAARCYRCVPYSIEYRMTVIARPDPEAVPMDMDGM